MGKGQIKRVAMSLAVVALGLYIYNKVPQVRQILGGQ